MTKENLIALYNIIKKNTEEMSAKTIADIKKMTDDDIELIKASPYPMEIFGLLSNESFSSNFSKEKKNQIIEIINNTKEENSYYTCLTATANRSNIINLINLVSNAKGRHQASDAYQIISGEHVSRNISDEHLEEIIKIVTTHKDKDFTYLIKAYLEGLTEIDNNLNTNEIDSSTTINIVKKIARAKSVRQASLGVDIALEDRIRKNIIDNGKDINEIAKYVALVTTEKNPGKVEPIIRILFDDDAIESGISYELAKIVKQSKELSQANYAADIAIDIGVLSELTKEDIIKLIDMVSQTETEYQALYSAYIACNYDAVKSGHVLELVDIVSKTKGEYQAKYASQLATNVTLLQTSKILRLVKLASIIECEQKICLSTNQIEYLIKDSKETTNSNENYSELYKLFDVREDFWKLFEENPEEAIKLLKETITNPKEDINSNTKVRIKKR